MKSPEVVNINVECYCRYEAESLLDEKPEGSFLLRDSAQDEYLFSVSFRRYGRSLHARIEEQGHRFSFDCHDPGVFMSRNIPELLDHYKVSQVTLSLTELINGQYIF